MFTENRSVTFPVFRYEKETARRATVWRVHQCRSQIFGDQMVAYTRSVFQRAEVDYTSAPAPTFDFKTPGGAVFGNPLAIPPHTAGRDCWRANIRQGPVCPHRLTILLIRSTKFSPATRGRGSSSSARAMTESLPMRCLPPSASAETNFSTATGAMMRPCVTAGSGSEIDIRSVSESRFQRIWNAADPIFDPGSPQFIGTTVLPQSFW